jgi:hypothetical protein
VAAALRRQGIRAQSVPDACDERAIVAVLSAYVDDAKAVVTCRVARDDAGAPPHAVESTSATAADFGSVELANVRCTLAPVAGEAVPDEWFSRTRSALEQLRDLLD